MTTTNDIIARRRAMAQEINDKHGSSKAADSKKMDQVKREYGLEAYLAWLVMGDFA